MVNLIILDIGITIIRDVNKYLSSITKDTREVSSFCDCYMHTFQEETEQNSIPYMYEVVRLATDYVYYHASYGRYLSVFNE